MRLYPSADLREEIAERLQARVAVVLFHILDKPSCLVDLSGKLPQASEEPQLALKLRQLLFALANGAEHALPGYPAHFLGNLRQGKIIIVPHVERVALGVCKQLSVNIKKYYDICAFHVISVRVSSENALQQRYYYITHIPLCQGGKTDFFVGSVAQL